MRVFTTQLLLLSFFFTHTATTEIYTLSLHDALPISTRRTRPASRTLHRETRRRIAFFRHPRIRAVEPRTPATPRESRSEEHTSELQSRRDLVCRLLLEKKKKQ